MLQGSVLRCAMAVQRVALHTFVLAALPLPVAAQAACAPDSPQVIIYHAGSLSAAFAQVDR